MVSYINMRPFISVLLLFVCAVSFAQPANPPRILGFPPDTSSLYLLGIDTAAGTFQGRGAWLDSAYLANALGVGAASGDGDGIYDGSGTVPTGSIATVTDSLDFTFAASNKKNVTIGTSTLWMRFGVINYATIDFDLGPQLRASTGDGVGLYFQNTDSGYGLLDGGLIYLDGNEDVGFTNYEDGGNIILYTTNSGGTVNDVLKLDGDGVLSLPEYGTGNYGTETSILGLNASNEVVKIDLDSADIAGGGGYDPDSLWVQSDNGTVFQVDTLDFQTGLDLAFSSGDGKVSLDFSEFSTATIDGADYLTFVDVSDGSTTKRGLASDISGGTNTNFAEDDLTLTGTRTHDMGSYRIDFSSTSGHSIRFNPEASDTWFYDMNTTTSVYPIKFGNTVNVWRFGMQNAEDFVVSDVTGGNDVFRIQDGAPNLGFYMYTTGQIRLSGYTSGGVFPETEVGLLGHSSNGEVSSIPLGTDGQVLTMSGTSSFSWEDLTGGEWTLNSTDLYPNSTSTFVGIGTTTPAHRLHVNETSGDSYIRVSGPGASTSDEVGIQFFDGATADSKIEFEEVGTESLLKVVVEAETVLQVTEDAAAFSAADAYIDIDAGVVYSNITSTAINLTLDEGHYGVYCTSAVTITLPSSPQVGREFLIVNNSGGNVTIDPGSTGTCSNAGIDCINFGTTDYTLSDKVTTTITAVATDGTGGWKWVTH